MASNWKNYTLDELYDVSSGLSKKREEFGFGYPFLTFKEVFHNIFVPELLPELANTTDKERERCSVRKGDVFLTRTSEKLEELGLSCVALKDYEGATFNGFTKRLRPNSLCKELLMPEYAAFYFSSSAFRNQVTSFASMTTRASLNNEMISKLKIDIPSLYIQQKIANLMQSLLEKELLNHQIIKNLERIASEMFKKWFTEFEFPYEQGLPYRSSGGEMVESEFGEIPKEWTVSSINDLGGIIGGGTPSKKQEEYYTVNGIPWITPKDLSSNKSKFIYKGNQDISELGLAKSSAKLMPKGTVLLSSRAPIGYIAIAGIDLTTNQGFKSIIPNKGYSEYFIYFKLKEILPVIEANAGGSTFKEISASGLKAIQIVLPDKKVVDKFNDTVNPLFEHIKDLELQIENLISLRDSLLPKLLSGEIEILDESVVEPS